jgi:hypothetical protein
VRSPLARAAIAVGALAAVVVLFIVLAGGDDDKSSSSTTTTTQAQGTGTTKTTTVEVPQAKVVTVKDGKPVGGIQKLEYNKGDRVRLVVRSDTADEIHVHGYDLMQDIPEGGGSVRFNFAADIDGVFEIELENAKQQIAELRVNP